MTELLFIMVCILIYLYSFLYRNLALLASGMTILAASLIEVNVYFVVGMILVLGIIRVRKTGVKDEI